MKLLPEIKLRNPFQYDYSKEANIFTLFKRLKIYSSIGGVDKVSIVAGSVFGMDIKTERTLVRLANENIPNLRLIRKGFFCHPSQVDETADLGYKAIVLIPRLIGYQNINLYKMAKHATVLGLDIIIELDAPNIPFETMEAISDPHLSGILINQRGIISGEIEYGKTDPILRDLSNRLHPNLDVILGSGISVGEGIVKSKRSKRVDYALVGTYLMKQSVDDLGIVLPKLKKYIEER